MVYIAKYPKNPPGSKKIGNNQNKITKVQPSIIVIVIGGNRINLCTKKEDTFRFGNKQIQLTKRHNQEMIQSLKNKRININRM